MQQAYEIAEDCLRPLQGDKICNGSFIFEDIFSLIHCHGYKVLLMKQQQLVPLKR